MQSSYETLDIIKWVFVVGLEERRVSEVLAPPHSWCASLVWPL